MVILEQTQTRPLISVSLDCKLPWQVCAVWRGGIQHWYAGTETWRRLMCHRINPVMRDCHIWTKRLQIGHSVSKVESCSLSFSSLCSECYCQCAPSINKDALWWHSCAQAHWERRPAGDWGGTSAWHRATGQSLSSPLKSSMQNSIVPSFETVFGGNTSKGQWNLVSWFNLKPWPCVTPHNNIYV